MFNNILSSKSLNVVIIEPSRQQGSQLSELIKTHQPSFKVMLLVVIFKVPFNFRFLSSFKISDLKVPLNIRFERSCFNFDLKVHF